MRFEMDLYGECASGEAVHESLCPLKGVERKDVISCHTREHRRPVYGCRRNSEERYAGRSRDPERDSHTQRSERIIRFAFEYAREHKRKKVLMSDKSNAMNHQRRICGNAYSKS